MKTISDVSLKVIGRLVSTPNFLLRVALLIPSCFNTQIYVLLYKLLFSKFLLILNKVIKNSIPVMMTMYYTLDIYSLKSHSI